MGNGFDTNELELWDKLLDEICNKIPQKTKKFMNTEGQKLKKQAKQYAKQAVKKKTGNYFKGIKKGKVYIYRKNGAFSVRVYGAAPHTHLIEKGHNIKNKKDGAVLGRARAFQVLDKSAKQFETEYQKDIENFVDEVIEEL